MADKQLKHSGGLALVHSVPESNKATESAQARAVAKALRDAPTYFDRKELALLLNVYGRHVSNGDWRDYAMDFAKDRAMFSVYRRNSEQPLFVIEKQPKLHMRQGQYFVLNQAGRILKRGHDLAQVLKVFETKLAAVN